MEAGITGSWNHRVVWVEDHLISTFLQQGGSPKAGVEMLGSLCLQGELSRDATKTKHTQTNLKTEMCDFWSDSKNGYLV